MLVQKGLPELSQKAYGYLKEIIRELQMQGGTLDISLQRDLTLALQELSRLSNDEKFAAECWQFSEQINSMNTASQLQQQAA